MVAALFSGGDFGVDQEELQGIDTANHQIIIGIAVIIEMETTHLSFIQQEGNNLFDICTQRMMTKVNQNLSLIT